MPPRATFLDGAPPGVISHPGTNVGDAIATALGGFDENSRSQRVIVLITDGEAHDPGVLRRRGRLPNTEVSSTRSASARPRARPCRKLDAAGNVIGYKQEGGQPVITRSDETTLQEIARIGGGEYHHAAPDGSELDSNWSPRWASCSRARSAHSWTCGALSAISFRWPRPLSCWSSVG